MKQASTGARIDEGRAANVAILNPLVQEITGALLDLGGAAHRDLVVAYVRPARARLVRVATSSQVAIGGVAKRALGQAVALGE